MNAQSHWAPLIQMVTSPSGSLTGELEPQSGLTIAYGYSVRLIPSAFMKAAPVQISRKDATLVNFVH